MKKSYKVQVWLTGIFWIIFLLLFYLAIKNPTNGLIYLIISAWPLIFITSSYILEKKGIFFDYSNFKGKNYLIGFLLVIFIIYCFHMSYKENFLNRTFSADMVALFIVSIIGLSTFTATLMTYKALEEESK